MAVGATRYDGQRASYSNYGNGLDILAPGGYASVDQSADGYGDGILQQTFGSSPSSFVYHFYQGTSNSTPHVAGVAALLLAQDPSSSPDDLRTAVQTTARDLGPPEWDSISAGGFSMPAGHWITT